MKNADKIKGNINVRLHINYHTKWGEAIFVSGNIAELGNDCVEKTMRLTPEANGDWTTEFPVESIDKLKYSYLVKTEDGIVLRKEWGEKHSIDADVSATIVEVYDKWQDLPEDAPFYSSAFTESIFRRNSHSHSATLQCGETLLNVYAPMIKPGQELAIVGESQELGHWNVGKAIVLSDAHFPKWNVAVKNRCVPVEYKFIVRDAKTHSLIAWEYGENRVLDAITADGDAKIINNMYLRNPLPLWRGAGTAIPVFSLRTDADYGVGDFYDLFPLIDWAEKIGQSIIQVLPINDTTMNKTNMDSYPYNANSTFALHPMYIRPDAIGKLADANMEKRFREKGDNLNRLSDVDYKEANELKEEYTKALYTQMWETVRRTTAFRKFERENSSWLKPYAAYCVLRDKYKTPDFQQWGDYSQYDEDLIADFVEKHSSDIGYVYFVQFFLDKQLREVCEYARKHRVALKGDVPIGISSVSVDAWQNPSLFHLDCSAGAPPDAFAVNGQNWCFPTYNWEMMRRDGYQWWKKRFLKMSEYFNAYRIDHILGFFRIWQIPNENSHGLLGTFYPAKPFTAEEMRSVYGFEINKELHTKPYIQGDCLKSIFGENSDDIKSKFLLYKGDDLYDLQDFVNTQQKVAYYFGQLENNETNCQVREGLMKLVDDVLFIRDRYNANCYHPRIDAQKTNAYRSLSEREKQCFDRLYEDFFYHRHNDFWRKNAMEKLPAITQATSMLVCGEDLGMIPACVPDVMNAQKYLSLEIPRMPKEYGREFGDTRHYPYLSVATTSTHDMSGIREWWEENLASTQRYFNNVLWHQGEAPKVATPQLCRDMVEKCLDAPSIFCILPLQDWMSIDGDIRRANPREERINIPTISRHYWRYRMHITIEQLAENEKFSSLVKECIEHTGRNQKN